MPPQRVHHDSHWGLAEMRRIGVSGMETEPGIQDMKKYALLITALVIFTADRATKILLAGSESILIPGILRLRYVKNTGMAFGWLSGNPIILALLSLVLLVSAFLALHKYHLKGFASAGAGMILGGASGNLFDRLAFGYVIDLFDFLFIDFFVFILADVMITAGVIMACIALFFRQQDWSTK